MHHSEVTLRLAGASEATAIAVMSRRLIEAGLEWSWTPQRVLASIRSPRANVVVARLGERITGFGIMRYGDEEAHLDLLAVEGRWRGQGLGRRLVEWLEKPALIGGIGAVFLEVRVENRAARDFYERLGYSDVGVIEGYYQGRESALRMRRELGVDPPAASL